MVANLTFDKKGYEKVRELVKPLAEKGQIIKQKALHAIDEDTDAFNEMMAAMKLPKKSDEEKIVRDQALQQATKKAIMVPYHTLELSLEAVKLAGEIAAIGNSNALSDAGVAAITANAAAKSAFLNVKINMASIEDEDFSSSIMDKANALKIEIHDLAEKIEADIIERI